MCTNGGIQATLSTPVLGYLALIGLHGALRGREHVSRYKLRWVRRGSCLPDAQFSADVWANSPAASQEQHISFANYDLAANRLPTIQIANGYLIMEVDHDQVRDVLAVIRMHGFQFADDSNTTRVVL